jgi:hypothetical protein
MTHRIILGYWFFAILLAVLLTGCPPPPDPDPSPDKDGLLRLHYKLSSELDITKDADALANITYTQAVKFNDPLDKFVRKISIETKGRGIEGFIEVDTIALQQLRTLQSSAPARAQYSGHFKAALFNACYGSLKKWWENEKKTLIFEIWQHSISSKYLASGITSVGAAISPELQDKLNELLPSPRDRAIRSEEEALEKNAEQRVPTPADPATRP